MSTKTYLVTGAAGFIGNHLARYLASQGHRVVCVDVELHENRDRMTELLKVPGIEYWRADLTDPANVAQLPQVYGVYHMAALNGTQNFYSQPFATMKHSTVPTILLLEHYAQWPLDFFFYAGSSESYASVVTRFGWEIPTGEDVPLGITDSRELRWSYGVSKIHGEVACFTAAAELGVPAVVGRFHNVYGPEMGTHHVIPDFIERGEKGVYSLYGATQTRSFIYIDDAVRAVVAVAENAVGEVVNIGSPDEVSMIDLAQTIMDQAGWAGQIEQFDAPSNSVERRAPKVERLGELIDTQGFVPLSEGIHRVLVSLGIVAN